MAAVVKNEGLKHRAVGETRNVPRPPSLTALMRAHLDEFGTTSDGRLFRGVRGDGFRPVPTADALGEPGRA